MKVYKSQAKDIALPELDILTFLFESDWVLAKEDTELHVEAANPKNSITKAEARDVTKRIAHTLRTKYGIGVNGHSQDVVLCTVSGNPMCPLLFYSTVCAGGVWSGASTAFTVGELVRQIKDADAKLLMCTAEFEERTVEAAKQCNIPLDRILLVDASTPKDWKLLTMDNHRRNVLDLTNGEKLEWERLTTQKDCHDVTGCLLYSSGTTGLPKGVRISHWNLMACNPICMAAGDGYRARCKREGRPFVFRTVAHLPMAHIAGIAWYSLNPFYMGGTCYWMQKYDFDSFIEYNRKYRTTVQMSVPPIWLQVAKSPKVTDHFDHVEVACTGAAPMGMELAKEVGSKLGKGKTRISQFWGTTETCGSMTGNDWDIIDDTFSVGGIFANLRLRLLDENDKDVEEGQPGELLIQGPVVFQGYHNKPEATKDAFFEGYYRTGDVGVFVNGLNYIVDRKKELIKYKGLQVAPAELEDTLIGHPKISDAAVIGVPDESAGEVPRGYVVKAAGSDVTEKEIMDFVQKNLANHKQLRGGVVFIKEVPKSPSGKILRKEIRQWAANGQSTGDPKAKL